jgi:T4 RnlA family RNA ligase
MNKYEKQLFKDLMNLVQRDECFFYKDFQLEDKIYRIFNYHLASWTSFQQPGAMDCRGTMFEVSDINNPILVSLPPQKFFNYEEGGVDHTVCKLGDKMVKMDGSLISTYLHKGQMFLKSKGSLFSSQANDAMNLLEKTPEFKEELERLVQQGYTVNLEYTSPKNRIVISYQDDALTVLSARNQKTGENLFATKLKEKLVKEGNFENILAKMVAYEDLRNHEIKQIPFIEEIRQEQEGEGYVIEFIREDGMSYLVKVKNLKYLALHHTKDTVNSPKKLFEAIINEHSDDLRSMFADNAYVLKTIDDMEKYVQPIYNNIVNTVREFTEKNKNLSRKEFAIKVQKEYPEFLGLLMNEYQGKPNNYKEFAIKHRKDIFKITEEEPELDEDGNVIKKHVKLKI